MRRILKDFNVGNVHAGKKFSYKPDAPLEKKIATLAKCFEEWLPKYEEHWPQDYNRALSLVRHLPLTQKEITAFTAYAKRYESQRNFSESGLFFTALFRASYLQGYNDFTFDARTFSPPLNHFGAFLNAQKNKPIQIKVDGSLGAYALSHAKKAIVTINGDVDYKLAEQSTDVFLEVLGSVTDECAYGAKCSEVIVHGTAGDWFGYDAEHVELTAYGRVGDFCGSQSFDCEFYFPRRIGIECGVQADDAIVCATRKDVLKRFAKNAHKSCSYFQDKWGTYHEVSF